MRFRWAAMIGLVITLGAVVTLRVAEHDDPQGNRSSNSPAAAHPTPRSESPTGEPQNSPNPNFTPSKLEPGKKPPQFIIVSFDGGGSHEKWTFWRDIAKASGMQFTAFLSGVYLVDNNHRTAYHGPGHKAGQSSIGFADDGETITTLIHDLNAAYSEGIEIGTHYNGHFCEGSGYHSQQFTTADWNTELDQFFHFMTDYKTINELLAAPALQVPTDSVKGGRTPCLEGKGSELYPALTQHGLTYDSSGIRNGISWPDMNNGVWEFPLHYVPLADSGKGVVAMDYNFSLMLNNGKDSKETASRDSVQVLNTYRNMFEAAYQGNRAPIVLGNHFNNWNYGAYSNALADFVKETCKKPEVRCLPYRDVINWMDTQDPEVLKTLQNQPAVYGVE